MIGEDAATLLKQFEDELEMGHAYRNSKKYEESIKRYNIALYHFLQLCELSNRSLLEMDYDRRRNYQMGTAFILSRILHSIYYGFLLYKPDRLKTLFLLLIWKKLVNSLGSSGFEGISKANEKDRLII